ncbi:ABC transporter substrate-binding protein [Jiangella mangrovi]|uniref:Multiple sugar transport system substrate-binding protein n=1 Tax=Jiangella mangrovi TaxID=1524084 RepID=A0A7W9LLR7_9ACTN|nr:substrate-binding domain-containing protein [Jiangella mangrovi]MBB5788367.1 multiple sugar transport system substrate-binding protein [Jiangella mangrovi]
MAAHDGALSRRTFLQASAAVGAGLAGSGLLAGCGDDGGSSSSGGGGGPATIRFAFWGSDDRVKRFQEAVDHFHTEHSSIRVEPEFGAIDAIETKTTVAMAGGNLPDVFWIVGPLLPQLGRDGHLVDLSTVIGNGIDGDGFEDSLLLSGQVDGVQYALPHGLQSIGLFANQRVLDEVGIEARKYPESFSWDEYADVCRQIREAKGDLFYGTDEPTYAGAPHFFRAWARQRGENLYDDGGDLGFTEDTLRSWLEYWQEMRDSGAAVPPQLALEQNPFFEGAPMIRGLSAFHMRNSNQLLELQGLSEDDLTLMPCPGNGGDGASSIGIDPNILGISADSSNVDAAVEFVNFLLNDPKRAEVIGTTIGAPATQAMREHILPTLSEPEAEFIEYIDFEATAPIDPIPPAPDTAGAFQDGVNLAMEELAYGRISIDDAVEQVFGDLRQTLTG